MPSVFFETFGCQMNVADSGDLADALFARGFTETPDPSDADLVVVNTCSVRAHAENRALNRLRQLAAAKHATHPLQRIWVVGCMAQRLGEALKDQIPGIDTVLGARTMDSALSGIDDLLADQYRPSKGSTATGPRAVSVFVPVMRGCDNYCSYCIVPYVRGPERSIPAGEIVDRIRTLAEGGAREVTLLGQNVNSYSWEGLDFPDLLERVHEIRGLHRIRFTTSHPKDCTEKLIRTIARLPGICKHLHLPVQSGSDRILSSMNRRYTRNRYLELIRMIRTYLPDADISTDVMVGFPGETEQDFRQTIDLFTAVRFTTAFMFAFSARQGTAAASLPDPVDTEEKKQRLTHLVQMQTAITKDHYASMVGQEVSLLVTRRHHKENGAWMGMDYGCKKAVISCSENLAGTILSARVRASSGMTLICDRI
jgi:tRNA-2-methylthio-N6-dimethylallyladenosine synthase